jgi:hypothetical protein
VEQFRKEHTSVCPGYRVRIVDGNCLAPSEKRLKPLRKVRSAALPGRSLVNLFLVKTPAVTLPAAPLITPAAPAPTPALAPAAPVAPATTDPPAIDATAAGRPPHPMSKLRIAGIVVGAVGVAGLATGAGFWFAAKGRHDDALKANDSDRPRAESLQSEAKHYVTAANISLAAGGTLAALGVAAFFLGAPARPATGAGAQALVLPSVGPGMAGFSAGGAWRCRAMVF